MTKKLHLLILLFLSACTFPSFSPTPLAAIPNTSVPTVPSDPSTAPVAPTATFVPSTRYFQNDFNSPDLTDWKTFITAGEPGLFDFRVENGFLLFDIGGKHLSDFVLYQPETYKNLRLDIRLVNQKDSPYALNLVCRYYEQSGWYQYEVFNSGAYNLYYVVWDTNDLPDPTLLAEGVADSMLPGNASNEVGFVCNDRDLDLYVNGQLVRSYTDNEYVLRDGRVGVGIASFDSTVLVALDWLKIAIP